jgi:hypothetical protein
MLILLVIAMIVQLILVKENVINLEIINKSKFSNIK